VLNWIPRLELAVEPERLTLADGKTRVEVEPRIWVSEDGRIVGLGRPSVEGGRPIDVLEAAVKTDPERFDALVKLFRRLFALVQGDGLFRIRPRVRVHGIAALRPLLDECAEDLIRDALVHAGAAKVEFAA
jgi:hypothetical protein